MATLRPRIHDVVTDDGRLERTEPHLYGRQEGTVLRGCC
jgi:hypothetical protein